MDELLDLVDDNDEIIGEVWKSKANSDPKIRHREVQVYIFDSENRLLMQQRSFIKKVYPGVWAESCAGHVGKGEEPEETAHRELLEEMGFDTKLKFVAKRLTKFSNETHFSYCYIGKYNGEKITIQKEEVKEVRFVKKSGFAELMKIDGKLIKTEIEWMEEIWEKNK